MTLFPTPPGSTFPSSAIHRPPSSIHPHIVNDSAYLWLNISRGRLRNGTSSVGEAGRQQQECASQAAHVPVLVVVVVELLLSLGAPPLTLNGKWSHTMDTGP